MTLEILLYNQQYEVCDFNANIMFNNAFDNTTFIAFDDDGANNGEVVFAVTLQSHDLVYQFISIDFATTVYQTYIIVGGVPSTIMMTTQVYSSSSSPSELSKQLCDIFY